jgi:hypothetical protein
VVPAQPAMVEPTAGPPQAPVLLTERVLGTQGGGPAPNFSKKLDTCYARFDVPRGSLPGTKTLFAFLARLNLGGVLAWWRM